MPSFSPGQTIATLELRLALDEEALELVVDSTGTGMAVRLGFELETELEVEVVVDVELKTEDGKLEGGLELEAESPVEELGIGGTGIELNTGGVATELELGTDELDVIPDDTVGVDVGAVEEMITGETGIGGVKRLGVELSDIEVEELPTVDCEVEIVLKLVLALELGTTEEVELKDVVEIEEGGEGSGIGLEEEEGGGGATAVDDDTDEIGGGGGGGDGVESGVGDAVTVETNVTVTVLNCTGAGLDCADDELD